MTDARLKGEWLTAPAHDGLSDAAYRILHNALMHSNEQGTDGAISMRELRFLYPGKIDPSWLDELEAAGFWQRNKDGYLLVGWSERLGQSSAAEVEAYRAGNRERQRRRRAGLRAAREVASGGNEPPSDSKAVRSPGVTRDVTGDVAHDVGQARTGQARPVLSPPVGLIDVNRVSQSGHEVTARETDGGSFDLATFRAQRGDLSRFSDDTVRRLANETLGRARGSVRNETAYVLKAVDHEWEKRGDDLEWRALGLAGQL